MRPIPQSVHDRARLLAQVHPLGVVAELVGKCPSQITLMKQRGWKAKNYSCKVRRRPSDFAIQANHMNHAELVIHYKAGTSTVTRWLHEIGKGRG